MKLDGKVIALAVIVYFGYFVSCLLIGFLLMIGLRGAGVFYFFAYSPLVGLIAGFPSLFYILLRRKSSFSFLDSVRFGFVSSLIVSTAVHGMFMDSGFNLISIFVLAMILLVPFGVGVKLVVEAVRIFDFT